MKTAITVFLMLMLLWMGSKSDYLTVEITDDQLLDSIQYHTFQYFWTGCEPNSGMAPERIHMDNFYPESDKNIIAIGGTGFGIMGLLAGCERGFISKDQLFNRLSQIVKFLEKADRFHGAFPHWMNDENGKVKPFSPKDDGGDLVETSYLMQGLIAVKQYYLNGNNQEKALSQRIDKLWREVEWNWYQKGGQPVLYWHWSPKYGWAMNAPIRGYNECLITYILGASSPTHPISTDAYHKGWARDGKIRGYHEKYGYVLRLNHNGSEEYGGPLFWAYYSYLGLDPHNLKDQYADYWKNNYNQVMIDYTYCLKNPLHFKGYGPNCWGLTASYSIPNYEEVKKVHPRFSDDPPVSYEAHKPGLDHGVISPTAAVSSIPYSPKESLRACRYFYQDIGDKVMGPYGFYDAFSEEYDWYPKKYLAIDQGPMLVMIENYRSGLLWKLFMKDKDVQKGLKRLGFSF